ncbi:MAG: RIP metalloprotease RseP [Acidobacteriota bacterium]
MLGTLQTLWWFLVLIGVMILLHELGHYLVARFFDVHIEAFSFGFGPRLFGLKRGETDFKFCAFPLGGYVKMAGEQPGEIPGAEDVPGMDPRAFPAKPRWQRLLIILAGPAVNVVLAIGILTGLFMYEYPKIPNPPDPIVGSVLPDSAAAKAGIQEGDRVVRIDGKDHPTWFDDIAVKEIANAGIAMDVWVERGNPAKRLNFTLVPTYDQKLGMGTAGWAPQTNVEVAGFCCNVDVAEKSGLQKGDIFITIDGKAIRSGNRLLDVIGETKGASVKVVYLRAGVEHDTTITPVFTSYDGSERWRIGASLQSPVEITKLPFGQAFSESVKQNKQSAGLLYKFLQGIIERRMSPKNLHGPIGIARLSGEAARQGATTYLNLMAMVSLNLAVVNMLPIPLLDGGGILMLLVEMLMRRDLSLRVKEAIVKVGFAFLMMVVVFVIYNDISKILPGT